MKLTQPTTLQNTPSLFCNLALTVWVTADDSTSVHAASAITQPSGDSMSHPQSPLPTFMKSLLFHGSSPWDRQVSPVLTIFNYGNLCSGW